MLCGKPPFLFTGICLYCMLCGKPPFLFTGICLYCMLCGTLPYRDDDIDVLRNAMTEKLKFVKQVVNKNEG
jgi:serine/threonine protein kinase